MECCTECFNAQFLKNFIKDNGELGICSYCETEDVYCIDVRDLSDLFDKVIKLYSAVEDFMPTYELKHLDVFSEQYLWQKLQNEWDIFTSDDDEVNEKIIRDMFPDSPHDPCKYLLDSYWRNVSEYWGIDVEYNDKLNLSWKGFRDEFQYQNRFFPHNKFDLKIIERLLPLLEYDYPAMLKLFRARKSVSKTLYTCSQVSKPPAHLATAGRANPPGIAYLYVASTINTVIKEVRAEINDFVTVGTFVCNSTLKLIDLRKPRIKSPFNFGDKLEFFLMHLGFLEILGNELSQPVSLADSIYEYLPSQYICEFIKIKGYDGVVYKSSLGDGFNVVLFDDDAIIKCAGTKLYQVISDNKFDLVP